MSATTKPPTEHQDPRNKKADFTGVGDYLKREVADPATVIDAPLSNDLPVGDHDTDESPAPVFSGQPFAVDRTKPKVPPTKGAAPASPVLWEEPAPARKRALPRKAIAAAVFGALLLALPILLRLRQHAQTTEESTSTLPEDLIVSERDLTNRIEVTADDFRSRRSENAAGSPTGGEAPALDSDEPAATLAERRKRRAQDPEDLVGLRGRSSSGHNESSASTATEPVGGYQRPYVYFEGSAAASSVRGGEPGQIAPAGTVISAVLTSPVDLRSGSTTIIARSDSDGPIPKTSRFVGSASSDGEGRVALRFDRLLLPDGREAKIQGEAQDPSGTFGIEGTVTAEGGTNGSATVARDLAQGTASDVASEAVNTLTGGIGGRLLQRVIGRAAAQHSAPSLATRRISIPAGAHFQIFLHQAVSVRG